MSCILFLAVIFHCVLLDICYDCLLSVYLSSTCQLGHVFSLSHPSLPTGKFFSWHVLSLCRTPGVLQRLGRAVMPCRHRAAWLFVSCLFKSLLAAVLRLSAQ